MLLMGQWKSRLSDIVCCSTKRVSKSERKLLYFYSIAFSSVKQSCSSSALKVYGTIFLRIKGARRPQLQEGFSSFQSFLGFLYFLRRSKKKGDNDERNTIDFFFFKK